MSKRLHPPLELPKFADLNPFGGPYTPEELSARFGLGGVALEARRRCIANPLFLASEVMSVLWQKNLMRTPSDAHREVAAAMVAQEPILYVDARGTAKTTLLDEVGGVHQLLSYVNDSLLFLQASEANAKALISQVKNHFLFNETLRKLFPEYAMTERDGNQLAFSVPCRRVRSREQSVETGTPGSRLAGRHYDIIFATDIWNENTTPPPCGRATVEMMKSLVFWYAQSDGLLKGKEINERAHKRLDSNRWHDADGVGEILRKEDAAGRRYFKRVVRGVTRGKDGKWVSTWPQVKTSKMMEEIFTSPTMNAATWAANFCSDPLPEGGMTFKREWFHEYGTERCQCGKSHELPVELDIAITVDPAFSDGKTAKKKTSRSGIVVTGVARDGHLWVLQVEAGSWSPNETVAKIFDLVTFWKARDPHLWVGVEDSVGARGIVAIFMNEMARTKRFIPYRKIKNPTTAKDSPDRMGPLHSHAEHFGVFYRSGHEELLEELLRFGVSERNDLADALAMRAAKLYEFSTHTVTEQGPTSDRKNQYEGRDFIDIDALVKPRNRMLQPWNRVLGSLN